jgi:hypothetical protein
MPTVRTPIARSARLRFSDEALDLFQQIRKVRCTCPPRAVDWDGEYWKDTVSPRCAGCERSDELRGRLFEVWPNVRPWFWPIVANPASKCPYPPNHANVPEWHRTLEESAGRWREIEGALAQRQQARRAAKASASSG